VSSNQGRGRQYVAGRQSRGSAYLGPHSRTLAQPIVRRPTVSASIPRARTCAVSTPRSRFGSSGWQLCGAVWR